MKKMYCLECGGDIMITRQVPERSWTIEENSLKKADNLNLMDGPDLLFHCENDREHNIHPRPGSRVAIILRLDQWMDEVEEFYRENVLPHL